jgi:predicted esterase
MEWRNQLPRRPRRVSTAFAILVLGASLAHASCYSELPEWQPEAGRRGSEDVAPAAGDAGKDAAARAGPEDLGSPELLASLDVADVAEAPLDVPTVPDVWEDAAPLLDLPASPEIEDATEPESEVQAPPEEVVVPPPDVESPPAVGPAGQFTRTVNVDGVTRTYQLFVPQSAVDAMAKGPVPLLIAFHGAGDNGANFILATDLTGAASSNAFVLAGPNGYNAGWFVQYQEGWPGTDGHETSLQNDAELALRIIEETELDYWVDPGRLYAVGHSRGGGLVGLLAILSGGMNIASGPWKTPFAAYGINAGYDAAGGQISHALASPKRPVWLIHGTADGGVPYSYGAGFAAGLEAAGWDVTFTTVQGGGHTWLWRPQYGQTNQDLWDYFMSCAGDQVQP